MLDVRQFGHCSRVVLRTQRSAQQRHRRRVAGQERLRHGALSVAGGGAARSRRQPDPVRLRRDERRRRPAAASRSTAVAGVPVVRVAVYRAALRRRQGARQPARGARLRRRRTAHQARLHFHQQPARDQRRRPRGAQLAGAFHHSLSRSVVYAVAQV